MNTGPAVPKLSYTNPPVDEVVIGLRFQHLEPLTVAYWGRLWDRYAGQFPRCDQQPRLAGPAKAEGEEVGIPPDCPRVWFIDQPGNRLVQAQSDCFFYNWRRLTGDDQYPGFGCLFKEYQGHLQTFRDFVKELGLGEIVVRQAELSYIDVVPLTQQNDCVAELGSIFPDLRWRDGRPTVLARGAAVVWNTQFVLPGEDGTLRVAVATGTRRADGDKIVRLEICAVCRHDQATVEMTEPWFQNAHVVMSQSFSYLTDPEVQRSDWGRVP